MKNELNPITSAPDLETLVMDILADGGKRRFDLPYSVVSLFRKNESAGFAYFDKTRLTHTLEIQRIGSGRIEFKWLDAGSGNTIHQRTFWTGGDDESIQTRVLQKFESACPLIDLLYRMGFAEYEKIQAGHADPRWIGRLEKIFGTINCERPGLLSFQQGRDLDAWNKLQDDLDRLSISQIHSWKERLSSSKRLKVNYRNFIRFKQRIHRCGSLRARVLEAWFGWTSALRRFLKRPGDNGVGVLDYILLDPIRWFGKVVRSNMGYSIALAVYSPFTFFFITQPMNPHAMRAVETVRNAGLAIVESKTVPSRKAPIATYTADVDETGWRKRMEHFKSMQIALESHLDYSKRVGRLEEIETQLAWPITLQGAWDESTRYRLALDYLTRSATDGPWSNLLASEKRRLSDIRIYLRDRMLRFILDHRYLILDPGSELGPSGQAARSAISIYSRMNDAILREHPTLPIPSESDEIVAIASRDPATDLPNPPFNREERSRYWESLYLMQNRTQESSNAGLQAYWWSVRNTVSVIQMMLATRREEMLLLSLQPRPPSRERTVFEDRYRSMLRLLDIEFHSIRPELSTTLPGDQEASYREGILIGIREFLVEREKL